MPKALLAAVCLWLAGCAALMNSDRPKYSGPLRKAAWHNATIELDRPPVIYSGVVYVVASPPDDSGRDVPRVLAFDLASGSQLWMTSFPVKEILTAAGSELLVYDQGGLLRYLDLKTGAEAGLSMWFTLQQVAVVDGVLYGAGPSGIVEAWPLATLPRNDRNISNRAKPMWQNLELSLKPDHKPVVSGDTVVVSAFQPDDWQAHKPAVTGIYGYDRKTGASRWKWELTEKVGQHSIFGLAAADGLVFVWMYDTSKSIFRTSILIAFDAATGQEKWRHTPATYTGSYTPPMMFEPGLVLASDLPAGKDGAAGSAGFLYQAFRRTTGEKVWESQTNWKYTRGVISGGTLLVSESKIHEVLTENNNTSPDSWVGAIDLRTGKELWRSEIVELGIFTDPVAGGGMVVVGSKPYHWSSPKRDGKPEVAGLWAYKVAP